MKIDLHLAVERVQDRPERHVDRRFGLVQLREFVEMLAHIERDETERPVRLLDVKHQMDRPVRVPVVALLPERPGSRLSSTSVVQKTGAGLSVPNGARRFSDCTAESVKIERISSESIQSSGI